jgi:SAM-dependent methyltransferase
MDRPSNRVSLFAPLHARSSETEWLDDLDIQGPELEESLRDLEFFNQYLGGHRALLRCLTRALPWLPKRRLRLVDIGCGRGDGLRVIARWSAKHHIPLELIGLDANAATLDEARKQSREFPEIQYIAGDAFGATLRDLAPDVVTASLLLHHFTTPALAERLPQVLRHTRALVIADLHRHVLAHASFRGLTKVLRSCAMTRHDGAVSVRRGFTRADLQSLIAPLPLRHGSIHWSFAFRYEVLLVP